MSRVVVAVVVALAVLGALAYAYQALRAPQGGEAQATGGGQAGQVLRFAVGPGDVLYYNVTATGYGAAGNNTTTSTAVNRVYVKAFAPPTLVVSVKSNGANETTVNVPYGIIALPLNDLGSERVGAPLSLGATSSCIVLTLEGEAGSPLSGRGYVYRGHLSRPNLTVDVRAVYDASKGVLVRLDVDVEVGGGGRLHVVQELVNATLSSGGYNATIRTPYTCGNGFSTDLRFVLEGIYELQPGGVKPVGIGEFSRAVEGHALVAVLYKPCPHCQRFWPNLLRAVNDTGVTVYAVILGPPGGSIVTWDLSFAYSNIVFPAMNKTGATGFPALIVFNKANPTAATAGEMSLDKLESWLKAHAQG